GDVVSGAVAVVVDPVADFIDRLGAAFAAQDPGHAGLLARLARSGFPLPRAAGLADAEALVDVAVAVVVDAVARELDRRNHRAGAGAADAARAGGDAGLADPAAGPAVDGSAAAGGGRAAEGAAGSARRIATDAEA